MIRIMRRGALARRTRSPAAMPVVTGTMVPETAAGIARLPGVPPAQDNAFLEMVALSEELGLYVAPAVRYPELAERLERVHRDRHDDS